MKITENQSILLSGGILVVSTKENALLIKRECKAVIKTRIEKTYNGQWLVYAIN